VVDLGSVRVVQLLYEPKEAFLDIQIDLLLAESRFHREALARRVPTRLSDLDLDFFTVSCEGLLILKMNAGRIIDRADAAALLRLNRAGLDVPCLLRWVTQLNLGAEWAEIWSEAVPEEPRPRESLTCSRDGRRPGESRLRLAPPGHSLKKRNGSCQLVLPEAIQYGSAAWFVQERLMTPKAIASRFSQRNSCMSRFPLRLRADHPCPRDRGRDRDFFPQ
jgi:hypothetical protein